jgi:hypothetical protein
MPEGSTDGHREPVHEDHRRVATTDEAFWKVAWDESSEADPPDAVVEHLRVRTWAFIERSKDRKIEPSKGCP